MPRNDPDFAAIDLDTLQQSPDARSTPFPLSNDDRSEETSANQSEVLTATSRRRDNETSCSSADIYKMRAHGNRGDRSPTRIEFNRVQRVRNHRGCFVFRKSESLRYKFAGVSVPGDRQATVNNKDASKGQLPSEVKKITKPATTDPAVSVAKKTDIRQPTKDSKGEPQFRERIDLYHFDRGNLNYFCTTDCQPQLHTDRLARNTADSATRFWAELYGSIHIAVAILVAFVLQTVRFVLYSVVRPLLVGGIQIAGDYVVKPLLTAIFNGCVQPPLVFGQNVFSSVADMLRPVCGMLMRLVEPVTATVAVFRLVEIHHYHNCSQRDEAGNGGCDNDDNGDCEAHVGPQTMADNRQQRCEHVYESEDV